MAAKKRKSTKKETQKSGKSATKRSRKPKATTAAEGMETHPRMQRQFMQAAAPSLPENFHALYDQGFRASRGIVPAATAAPQTEGHRRMAREVRGLEVHYDSATQLPNFVVCPQ